MQKKPKKFNPDRVFIDQAVQDYLKSGGKITVLDSKDIPDYSPMSHGLELGPGIVLELFIHV